MIAPVSAPLIEATDALKGRDMLCFSHDWNGDPLSKTHLMRLLARDNRILWVNSIGYRQPTVSRADISRAFRKVTAALQPVREVEPNLFVLNPLVVPAYGISAVRRFNKWFLGQQVRRAMRRLRFKKPINWVFNPAANFVAGTLGEDKIIYYCVDEYTAFSGVSTNSLIESERELLHKADMVFVSAGRLLETKRRENPNTVLVRHGVNYSHFRTALDDVTIVPAEIASLPRPVLGYFGLMSEDWFDVPLIERVAKSFPGGSVVLLGKVAMDLSGLTHLPNVHVLGRKPYQDLPAYCKGFDVGLLPFPISDVTLNANPLKVREYLAAGLPVVSTAIPEVEYLGTCLIGNSPEEFVRQVSRVLDRPGSDTERSLTMQGESWDAKLDQILDYYSASVLDGSRVRG